MRVWLDLSNSPHVPLFDAVRTHLEKQGMEVVVTARDHAQTVALARLAFGRDLPVIGAGSPSSRTGKLSGIVRRASKLSAWAKKHGVDVAISHGSYAQIVAGRRTGIPTVTMMDYEYQPANHLSFRLANVVVVPTFFDSAALLRCGARPNKTVRYDGWKEEAYITTESKEDVRSILGIPLSEIMIVMRPAPTGALYHRGGNDRFDSLLDEAARTPGVTPVVLPRFLKQKVEYETRPGVLVPSTPMNGISLLKAADALVGAGGTMSREAALVGTPAYTVFDGKLGNADRELIRRRLLHDLRQPGTTVPFERKGRGRQSKVEIRAEVFSAVRQAIDRAVGRPVRAEIG